MLLAPMVTRAQQAQPSEDDATYKLAPVKVTADKVEKDLNSLPASVSVLTEIQLEEYNITDTQDVFRHTPNMHLVELGHKASVGSMASIRGITNFMSGDQVIGFFVDDIYQPNFLVNLMDVERIEILRGPQGILYGKNTEAGLINVITKQPTNDWTFMADGGIGNYSDKKLTVSTGGAVVEDSLFLRVAGQIDKKDGYFSNKQNDDKQVDESQDIDLRTSLRWLPTNKFDIRLTTDYLDYSGNYAQFARMDEVKNNPHKVNVNWPGEADEKAMGASLRVEYDLEDMKFLSISSGRTDDRDICNDVDFSPFDAMRLYLKRDDDVVSQEFRLHSDDENSPFQWLTGAYFSHEEKTMGITTVMTGVANLNQDGKTTTNGVAVFGQGSYLFENQFEVSAGLRYSYDKKDFAFAWNGGAPIGVPNQKGTANKSFTALLPRFSLSYKGFKRVMPYVTVARGYKNGGFNLKASPGIPYDSEFSWSYETGVKTDWFDDKLELNLAAFYIKREDLQVELPSFPDFTIANAAEATSMGLELEMRARPIRQLELTAGTGFTAAKFDSFEKGGVQLKGNRLPNVPGFSAQIGGTYRFDNGLFINADYMRTGSLYVDSENTQKLASYQTVNSKVGYASDRFDIYVWAKNLTDSKYITRAFSMGGNWYARAGDPMTFGLGGTLRF